LSRKKCCCKKNIYNQRLTDIKTSGAGYLVLQLITLFLGKNGMKHQKQGRKFGRMRGPRQAFLKGLMVNLVDKGKITTTHARAKETQREIEKLVTRAKKQDLASLRLLISRVSQKPALKLFYDIAPKYSERQGGYTRVVKLSDVRKGDGAEMSIIEFV
jgi:large subunit ribosomal protein L17